MPHYPGSTSRPVPSHGGPASSHMGLVVHITTNDYDPYGFFSNPANQASSNYWVAADGAVSEYVNPDLSAWAQANGNGSFVSVETSGKVGTPMTDAQVTAVAALYAWGHATYGWPLQLTNDPGTSGLGWHGMGGSGWGGHSSCPGDARRAQLPLVLARAINPASTPGDDMDAVQARQLTELHDGMLSTLPAGFVTDSAGHPLNPPQLAAWAGRWALINEGGLAKLSDQLNHLKDQVDALVAVPPAGGAPVDLAAIRDAADAGAAAAVERLLAAHIVVTVDPAPPAPPVGP